MADYYTLLTDAGIAYETACKAAGTPIKLSQISVGDGGGTQYNPAATATALKREVWRGPLNALFQDENNPSWLLAEVTIPSDVGGWYVREAGIWTDTGILYAIVKYPESFKPVLATSGSGKEFYIRSIFETSNAELVTLLIDDTVVKATRAWVASYVADELAKLDRKQSVRVATTANIVLSGAQAIDGVAVIAGNRVLVKSQTLAKDNGIYVAANGAWVRAKDADASVEVTSGLIVSVEEGATLANTIWQLITDGAIVLGTTGLAFQNVTQGFAAINSPVLVNPTANTPPIFDSSKLLATTEFVERAKGNYRGFLKATSNTTLVASTAFGSMVSCLGTFNVTLPAANSGGAGGTVSLRNRGTGVVTILCPGSDNIKSGSLTKTTMVMPAGSTLDLTTDGASGWWASGSAQIVDSTAINSLIGNYSGIKIITASTALTVNDTGCLIIGSVGLAGLDVTLPKLSTTTPGQSIIISAGAGSFNLQAFADDLISIGLSVLSAVPIDVFESIILVSHHGGWRVVSGTVLTKYSKMFAAVLGYDSSQALPSGWLCKTGHGSTNGTAGVVSITFPVAFPTACMAVVANYGGASSAQNPSLCQIGNPTRTGFTGYLTSVISNAGAVTTGGFNWVAIGY
ncbi:phage tail protein [Pseudomonas brassicacearum]|uniref:phage tail protein n=1 Tax=Pseudomonas brassicacearum TaxID=930166 RepID=UPI001D02E2E7|nr:phage tail protein [Pseudomonas brassicacearum]